MRYLRCKDDELGWHHQILHSEKQVPSLYIYLFGYEQTLTEIRIPLRASSRVRRDIGSRLGAWRYLVASETLILKKKFVVLVSFTILYGT